MCKTNLIIQSKPEDEEERSKRELQIDCYFEVLGQASPHNPTTQGKPQPTEHWPIEKSHWICCHCVILVLYNAVCLWLQMNTPQSFVVCCANPFLNMCGKSSSVYWNPYTSLLNGKSLGIWNTVIRTPTKDGPRCRTQDYNYLFTSELLQKKN